MAQIVASYEEVNNTSGTWSHVFQGGNTGWLGFDQRQILGNFFLGLQGQTQNIWNTQIPPGSTIVSATMEYLPFNNNANPSYTTTMNTPDRVQQTYRQDPMQSPFEVFRGYRPDMWSNASVACLSTTFTAIFGTEAVINSSWIMRQIDAPGSSISHRDHLAQRITTRTGNMDIASLLWELRRTGNPTGNLTVRIQGVTTDRGVEIPDGVDFAVSNPIAASSIGTTVGFAAFTFPGTVTLDPLTDYFILIEPEYTANNADYISVHHQNTFLTTGRLLHFGDGLGMDWQNYPGVVDLNQSFQLLPMAGQDVIWPINAHTFGNTEVSPDITALVQAQVDASNYTIDSGIIISLSRGLPTAQSRIMSANSHATQAGPILRITYDEPVSVPNVVGLTQAAAELSIVAAGLTVGTVTLTNDAVVPVGDVISQVPLSGATAALLTLVDIVVSFGPQGNPIPGKGVAFANAGLFFKDTNPNANEAAFLVHWAIAFGITLSQCIELLDDSIITLEQLSVLNSDYEDFKALAVIVVQVPPDEVDEDGNPIPFVIVESL